MPIPHSPFHAIGVVQPIGEEEGIVAMITPIEMLARMGAAVVLGGAIGYERERSGHPAGFRTHFLVSLASASFMLVSAHFVYFQHYEKDNLVVVDPSRIAASVVTGVGFLGAGAILRTGLGIQGLTTAASLWLVSAIGLASGSGMFLVAVIATLLSLFGLVALRRVENKQWRLLLRRVVIVIESQKVDRLKVRSELRRLGATVTEIDYMCNRKNNMSNLVMDVGLANERAFEQMLVHLETVPGVCRVRVRCLNT